MRALTMFGLYTTSLGMAHLFSLLLLDYWYVGFLPYLGLSTWLFIRWYSKKRKALFYSKSISLGKGKCSLVKSRPGDFDTLFVGPNTISKSSISFTGGKLKINYPDRDIG